MILTEVVMNALLMQGTPVTKISIKNIAEIRNPKVELTLAPLTVTP